MWWTTEQATDHLGVKPKTLYTYVSRGWIRSRPAGGRRRHYLASDVQELATRAAEAAGRSAAAGAAMRWGPPVLTTELCLVDPDGPYYRGHAALTFSEEHTPLEQVAAHLWDRPVSGLPVLQLLGPAPDALADAAAMALLVHRPVDEEAALACMLAAVAWHRARPSTDGSVAARLAHAFDAPLDTPLDAALALCVDHELNASTFAARVAAGTESPLYACLQAAVATWSGPLHGGASDALEAELAVGPPSGHVAFDHPLYPAGDPRAERLFELAGGRPPWTDVPGRTPNLDAGLVAFRRAHDLPRGSAAALFLVGRTVGWCAHVAEQRGQGMIRPRALYRGA